MGKNKGKCYLQKPTGRVPKRLLTSYFFLGDFRALDLALRFDAFAFLGLDAFRDLALTVFGLLAFFGLVLDFFLALLAADLGFFAGDLLLLCRAAFRGDVDFLATFFLLFLDGDLFALLPLARRKEPEAPTPLVCLRTPVARRRRMASLIWASAFGPTL